MKKAIIYFVLLSSIFQSSLLSYSANPKDFVNELVNEAISKLSDKSCKDQKKFIEKVALENVDISA